MVPEDGHPEMHDEGKGGVAKSLIHNEQMRK